MTADEWRSELTDAMKEAGAKVLDEFFWKRDPFAKQIPMSEFRSVAPLVYRAMTLARAVDR